MEKCKFCNRELKNRRCYHCISQYRRYANRLKYIELLGGKCEKCGYDDVSGLDFHHQDPSIKEWGISYLLNKTDKRIEEEIKKCILLCSNCHRKIHYEDREYLKEAFDISLKNRINTKGFVRLNQRKVKRPSKEELYQLVWSKPTSLLAKEFGVSDKAIEKWCISYDINKPPRGYWKKQAV